MKDGRGISQQVLSLNLKGGMKWWLIEPHSLQDGGHQEPQVLNLAASFSSMSPTGKHENSQAFDNVTGPCSHACGIFFLHLDRLL